MTTVGRCEADNGIDRVAASWAARLDRGGLSTEESRELAAWVSTDRRHAGALVRAEAVLAHCDRTRSLGAAGIDGLPQTSHRHARRARLGIGAAAALVIVGIVAVAVPPLLSRGDVAVTTARGEVRSMPLSDGSQMTLDAQTEAHFSVTAQRRIMTVDQGRALFDVTADPARPFVVTADDVTVTAVGTSFSVERKVDNSVTVVLREGSVDVHRKSRPSWSRRLVAPAVLSVPTVGQETAGTVSSQAIANALAWREGMINLDDTRLGDAAIEFARYSDYRIVVDPDVADSRITGRFALSDPRGFALAVGDGLGLRTRAGERAISITR